MVGEEEEDGFKFDSEWENLNVLKQRGPLTSSDMVYSYVDDHVF